MTITTTQKIIKIGTSQGVTLPAKQLRELRLSDGDEVRVTIEPLKRNSSLSREYEAFKKHYGETLKRLAGR